MMPAEVKTHPFQIPRHSRGKGRVNAAVSMRAYEVYREVHGEQEALVTGGCRGGFGTEELIAFLYAHSYPKAEWSMRVDEAFAGFSTGEE